MLSLGGLLCGLCSLLCVFYRLELRQSLSLGYLPDPLLLDLILHELDALHKTCLLLRKGRSCD